MGECLSAVYITYQCKELDYCFEESMRSSLDLCDKVYVNDGGSTDGTLDILKTLENTYGKDRFILVERKWKHDRSFWSAERNFLLDLIPNSDYVLNIAADECFHEKHFSLIRDNLVKMGNRKGMQFKAVHFYGTPAYTISGKSWARVLTKLWSNSTGIRYLNRNGGCADDPIWPNKTPVHFNKVYRTDVPVYHYGHSRSPKAVGIKNKKADELYKNSKKYLNGALPEINTYDYNLAHFIEVGAAKPFEGTHPKYMLDWVNNHIDQDIKWNSKKDKS